MRKLEKNEIKRKDCGNCDNCYKRKNDINNNFIGLVKLDGHEKHIHLYCKFDKCPYHKDTTPINWSLLEKGGYHADRYVNY